MYIDQYITGTIQIYMHKVVNMIIMNVNCILLEKA